MSKFGLFIVASLALSQSAFSQIVVPPNVGGGLLQQIPPPPARQRPEPEIRIERGGVPATAAADNVKFPIRSLRVTGQALYSEA